MKISKEEVLHVACPLEFDTRGNPAPDGGYGKHHRICR